MYPTYNIFLLLFMYISSLIRIICIRGSSTNPDIFYYFLTHYPIEYQCMIIKSLLSVYFAPFVMINKPPVRFNHLQFIAFFTVTVYDFYYSYYQLILGSLQVYIYLIQSFIYIDLDMYCSFFINRDLCIHFIIGLRYKVL